MKLWLVAVALAATVALAGTPPPTQQPTPAPCGDECGPNDVTPRLRCACRLNADEVYAQFEYTNTNTHTIFIAAGTARNYVTPGAASQGQPSSFASGTHVAQSLIFNCTAHPTGVAWVIQQSHVASASASCVSIPCDSDGQCGRCDGQNVAQFVTDSDVEEGDLVRLVHNTTDQQRAHVRRIYERRIGTSKNPLRYFENWHGETERVFYYTYRQCVAPNGDVGHVGFVFSRTEAFSEFVVNNVSYPMTDYLELLFVKFPDYPHSVFTPIFGALYFMIVSHQDDRVVHMEVLPFAPFDDAIFDSPLNYPTSANFSASHLGRCAVSSRNTWWLAYDSNPVNTLGALFGFHPNIDTRAAAIVVNKYDAVGTLERTALVESQIGPLVGNTLKLSDEFCQLFFVVPNTYALVAAFTLVPRAVPATRADGTTYYAEHVIVAGAGMRPISVEGVVYLGPASSVYTSAILLELGDDVLRPDRLSLVDATAVESDLMFSIDIDPTFPNIEDLGQVIGKRPTFAGSALYGVAAAETGAIFVSGVAAGNLYVPDSAQDKLRGDTGHFIPRFAARRITHNMAPMPGGAHNDPYVYIGKYEPSTHRWEWMSYTSGRVNNPGLHMSAGSLRVQQLSGNVVMQGYFESFSAVEHAGQEFGSFSIDGIPVPFNLDARNSGSFTDMTQLVVVYEGASGRISSLATLDGDVLSDHRTLVVSQDDEIYVGLFSRYTPELRLSIPTPPILYGAVLSAHVPSAGNDYLSINTIIPNLPKGWHCASTSWGSGDGCDCECGVDEESVDPDCRSLPFTAPYNVNQPDTGLSTTATRENNYAETGFGEAIYGGRPWNNLWCIPGPIMYTAKTPGSLTTGPGGFAAMDAGWQCVMQKRYSYYPEESATLKLRPTCVPPAPAPKPPSQTRKPRLPLCDPAVRGGGGYCGRNDGCDCGCLCHDGSSGNTVDPDCGTLPTAPSDPSSAATTIWCPALDFPSADTSYFVSPYSVVAAPNTTICKAASGISFLGEVVSFCADASKATPAPVLVPAGWTCDPAFYGANDGCDCNCGCLDLDCAAVYHTIYDCPSQDYVCSYNATCTLNAYDKGTFADLCSTTPTPAPTLPPPTPPPVPAGWTCNNAFYGANDGCDCGCGCLDPDCTQPYTNIYDCPSYVGYYCSHTAQCTTNSSDAGTVADLCPPPPPPPSSVPLCGGDGHRCNATDGCDCDCVCLDGGYDPDCGPTLPSFPNDPSLKQTTVICNGAAQNIIGIKCVMYHGVPRCKTPNTNGFEHFFRDVEGLLDPASAAEASSLNDDDDAGAQRRQLASTLKGRTAHAHRYTHTPVSSDSHDRPVLHEAMAIRRVDDGGNAIVSRAAAGARSAPASCAAFPVTFDPSERNFALEAPYSQPFETVLTDYIGAGPVSYPVFDLGDKVFDLVFHDIYTGDGSSNGTSSLHLGDKSMSALRTLGYHTVVIGIFPAWCQWCKAQAGTWGRAALYADSEDPILRATYEGLDPSERVEIAARAPGVLYLSGLSEFDLQTRFSRSSYATAAQEWIAFNQISATNAGVFNDSAFQMSNHFAPCPHTFPAAIVVDLERAQWVYAMRGFFPARDICVADVLESRDLSNLPTVADGDIPVTDKWCGSGKKRNRRNYSPIGSIPHHYVPTVTRFTRDLAKRETVALEGAPQTLSADHQGNVHVTHVFNAQSIVLEQVLDLGEHAKEDEMYGHALVAAPAGSTIGVSFPTPEQPSHTPLATPGGRLWADGSSSSTVEFREPGARQLGYATEAGKFIGRNG